MLLFLRPGHHASSYPISPQVLTLARDDFEAGFGANAASSATPSAALKRRPSGDEDELRARLISFIRMVSPQVPC
jgi:hypothetical protein